MTADDLKRLRALRDLALSDAVKAAIDQPGELAASLDRVEKYDRLLEATPRRRWRDLAPALVIAILCVSLLGAGLSLRIPVARIVLEAKAGTATVALTEAWQFNGGEAIRSRSLSLRQLDEIDLPPALQGARPLAQNAWVDLEGDNVAVSALTFEAGSIVTFESGARRQIDLYSRGGNMAGTLLLTGLQHIAAGVGNADPDIAADAEFAIPEIVDFKSGSEGIVPARLRLNPDGQIDLYDLRVSGLSFYRDVPSEPGDVRFVSTIEDGRVTLSDVGRPVPLARHEKLSLQNVEGRIQRLSLGDEIEVAFEGKASRVLVGPEGFQQDLTPTIAEYLYHNERVVFLWSALVFTWGVLWSARRMLAF
jgi:hypothetical protein